VKIRIINDGNSAHPMQHPIHFHGQRFLVLNKNGTPETNLVWKDTVNVPAGEYADVLVDMSNPGMWMAHCHILEHIEAGMMFTFTVEE
jgi:FtsP/CotA-like multicopper oxidase with cupredoxin domain